MPTLHSHTLCQATQAQAWIHRSMLTPRPLLYIMQAVSPALLQTIKDLQNLPSLSTFSLAGGTNLSLRFNHLQNQIIALISMV